MRTPKVHFYDGNYTGVVWVVCGELPNSGNTSQKWEHVTCKKCLNTKAIRERMEAKRRTTTAGKGE